MILLCTGLLAFAAARGLGISSALEATDRTAIANLKLNLQEQIKNETQLRQQLDEIGDEDRIASDKRLR